MKIQNKNIAALQREIDWFSSFVKYKFSQYFDKDSNAVEPLVPDVSEDGSFYENFIFRFVLSEDERVILMLSIVPFLQPDILDIFHIRNSNFDKPFTEFGGGAFNSSPAFMPTVETACFLLCDDPLSDRFRIRDLLSAGSPLIDEDIVRIGELDGQQVSSFFNRSLSVNEIWINYFINGVRASPDSLETFPASKITTEMEWNDLVLEKNLKEEVEQICQWVKGENILNDLNSVKKYIKPGFRCLFYGPPGTGKTLTATLIGKETNRDVYRIDLSVIVSKYIGETEKNLSRVFDYAEKRNWVLFFDEADALFGKRTQTNSSNDRFANQEVAYLLQRIEEFPGVVILASNLKSNIDEAFSRRFQAMIYFPMPDSTQRLRLWENMFSAEVTLDEACDLGELAENYELSGGSAINVFRYGMMKAMSRSSLEVKGADLVEGIRKEYLKYGRTL